MAEKLDPKELIKEKGTVLIGELSVSLLFSRFFQPELHYQGADGGEETEDEYPP